MIRRSHPDAPLPDLFCMALLARFQGYYPGYAADLAASHRYLTWCVLKAHTANRAGRVRLASADPRDPPRIDFHYFDEGSAGHEADLRAVVEGVKSRPPAGRAAAPSAAFSRPRRCRAPTSQTDDEIARFVRDNAWGHHASCTCPIGPREAGGVLDARLRVHGTRGLRVADASVFPRIPGFFIASAVYMVGEKAAEMILDGCRAAMQREGACNGL